MTTTKADHKTATDQARDMNRNPDGKGGFGDHPENRNPGGWKKEDTARFKLEQMIKLSSDELKEIQSDSARPAFEQKLAKAVSEGDWRTIREIIHEVYGKPKESVDMTSNGETIATPTVRIIDERPRDTNTG